ncbi:MAG TPA: DbpA RNA binding domain-containing protein [Gemmatimonadales bacterium]|nr:DbpA RNA binding domain-containing protein [Gemmatimonadales bacterium]
MDAAPVVARGHNLAALVPPVPAAAAPFLEAIPETRPTLILTADADRAVALHDAAPRAASLAVTGIARALRRLAAGLPGRLAVSAPDALRLLARSALRAAEFQTVVLAWPEQLDDEGREALEAVMAEAARDAQRIILASVPGPETEALVERYAFKAVAFGFPPNDPSDVPAPPGLGPAGYVVARPGRFEAVHREILDALDPASDDDVTVALCPPSREAAEALARAAGAGGVGGAARRLVFVIEPCQLPWLRSAFAPLSALRLPTALDALERQAEALRARLARTIERERLDRELFLIGPLLDRFDPAEVAAAALHLGAPAPGAAESLADAAPPGALAEAPGSVAAWAKLWVGVGKKDGVRPGDVLGAIVGEAKLAADRVGKIEVRELFCLVEVRAEEAERVVRALTGTTLRGRRVAARLDRGHAPAPPGRSGRA